jgi:hypothetical protein
MGKSSRHHLYHLLYRDSDLITMIYNSRDPSLRMAGNKATMGRGKYPGFSRLLGDGDPKRPHCSISDIRCF